MPKPTIVPAGQVPARRGTRVKSSAQQVVDAYVIEAREANLFADLPADGSGVLLHFTVEDDPEFAFTGSTQSHLKDRCRRMVRLAMKEHLPAELDAALTITYDIPIRRHSDEAFGVEGFKAFVTRK